MFNGKGPYILYQTLFNWTLTLSPQDAIILNIQNHHKLNTARAPTYCAISFFLLLSHIPRKDLKAEILEVF